MTQFRIGLGRIGRPTTDREVVARMVDAADSDGDGEISLSEFKEMLLALFHVKPLLIPPF